ncbi:MAG: hypothetical protein NT155_04475 [Candidatus Staskawiczbacteria bacterium]|nr:hypothetical protein [Candidatus Staskawiczbacteria bacterium]
MSPEPGEKKQEEVEVNEQVREYEEEVNSAFSNLESIGLTENKAVRIKLVGQEEIVYKSPRETFISKHGVEYHPEIMRDKFKGIRAPIIFSRQCVPKYSGFNTPEGMAALKRDIDAARVIASWDTHYSVLDEFAETVRGNMILRDEIFRGIPDKDVSDGVRMINLCSQGIIHRELEKQQLFDYFTKIREEDPKFLADFLDFSVRMCITTGHNRSETLFQLFRDQPNLYQGLDQAHKDFSLPYLFERDCVPNCKKLATGEWYEERKKVYKEIFDGIGMDAKKIQKTLKDAGSDREYCPGFFDK